MSGLVKLFCLFLAVLLAFGGAVGIALAVDFDGFTATLTMDSGVELLSVDGEEDDYIDGKVCTSSCGVAGT